MIQRPLRAIDQLKLVGTIFQFQRQHFEACLTALKRIAAFVGEPSNRLANRGKALCLQGALFGALLFRNVARDA